MSGALTKSMSGGSASDGGGGGGGGGGGSHLDTQTVTTGTQGSAPMQDRNRGFISGTIGSITDGTSNVYAGAAITSLYYDENGGTGMFYKLAITGAANSGWTTMTIDSTAFTRASATYSSGTWTWTTAHTVATQALGANGTVHTVYFD